jgi:hypothetical protein
MFHMKPATKCVGVVDPETIAENAEIGATVAAELAQCAMENAADDDLPALTTLPRFLTWSDPTTMGHLIKTDRAEILIPLGREDDFRRMLEAMIHPEFWRPMAGNC